MSKVKNFGSIIALTALLGFTTAATAAEYTYCFNDSQYSVVTLMVNLDQGVIVGEASAPDSWSYNAALTGAISGNTVSFAIEYPDNTGLRFYQVALGTMTGTTWGKTTSDPSQGLYDAPHAASLVSVPCDAPAKASNGGANGAAK